MLAVLDAAHPCIKDAMECNSTTHSTTRFQYNILSEHEFRLLGLQKSLLTRDDATIKCDMLYASLFPGSCTQPYDLDDATVPSACPKNVPGPRQPIPCVP